MITETENEDLDIRNYRSQKIVKTYKEGRHTTEVETTTETVWSPTAKRKYVYSAEQKVTVFDVAAYIVKKLKSITTMKLHKLLYYSQVWSLVWDETELFSEKIEAWANGPVIKELFSFHRGQYMIDNVSIGNPNILTTTQKETVDSVIDFYGDKSSQWLIQLTHMEDPWKDARQGMNPEERGNRIISLESMANYYSAL